MPNGEYSPFNLGVQYEQFLEFKARPQLIREKGWIFAKLMPQEEYSEKALYTFDIGQNDPGAGLFFFMSIEEVNTCVPDMINAFSTYVERIYNLGARSFWIHNTGPVGCLGYILVGFPTAEKDVAGCAKPYIEVAQYFNHKLKEIVFQLRKDFPTALFTYVDVYSLKYALFIQPKTYGFELPLVACRRYGNQYNDSSGAVCGKTIAINDTQKTVGSCDRPSVRVVWDGEHCTEAANKFILDQISTGVFSDPPVPLKMACHSTADL